MTVEQAIIDVSALSPSDRIRVVQAIWDGLADHVGMSPSTAMKSELDRRWAKFEADPSATLTEEQFREEIRAARGR